MIVEINFKVHGQYLALSAMGLIKDLLEPSSYAERFELLPGYGNWLCIARMGVDPDSRVRGVFHGVALALGVGHIDVRYEDGRIESCGPRSGAIDFVRF